MLDGPQRRRLPPGFPRRKECEMPYARITLCRGKPAAFLQTLSDALHAALMETFAVPAGDRFHVFHQMEPEELVFDRDYLGGPRSAGFVLIHLTIGRPRNDAAKRAFYRSLTDRLKRTLGVRPEDVMVVISSTGLADWSFANGDASMLPPE